MATFKQLIAQNDLLKQKLTELAHRLDSKHVDNSQRHKLAWEITQFLDALPILAATEVKQRAEEPPKRGTSLLDANYYRTLAAMAVRELDDLAAQASVISQAPKMVKCNCADCKRACSQDDGLCDVPKVADSTYQGIDVGTGPDVTSVQPVYVGQSHSDSGHRHHVLGIDWFKCTLCDQWLPLGEFNGACSGNGVEQAHNDELHCQGEIG